MRFRSVVLFLLVLFVLPVWGYARSLGVAALFSGSVKNDWNSIIHGAILRGKKEFGYSYSYRDILSPPGLLAAAKRFASSGYGIIYADGFAAEGSLRMLAMGFPDVKFILASGRGAVKPNVSVFDDWIQEPVYLCGMMAGRLTRTNIIGIVGSYPVPNVNRLINAFIMGAREVNPKVKVKVDFVGSWYAPSEARALALFYIGAGADVMFAETPGVIEACKEKKVLAFGNLLDRHKLAPDTVVTSAIWDFYPTVRFVTFSVLTGTWVPTDLRRWSMMAKGGARLAPFYDFTSKLPADVLKMVETRKEEIIEGKFYVPIDDSYPKSD